MIELLNGQIIKKDAHISGAEMADKEDYHIDKRFKDDFKKWVKIYPFREKIEDIVETNVPGNIKKEIRQVLKKDKQKLQWFIEYCAKIFKNFEKNGHIKKADIRGYAKNIAEAFDLGEIKNEFVEGVEENIMAYISIHEWKNAMYFISINKKRIMMGEGTARIMPLPKYKNV